MDTNHYINDLTLKIRRPGGYFEVVAVQQAIVKKGDGGDNLSRVEFYRAEDKRYPTYSFDLEFKGSIPEHSATGIYLEHAGRKVQQWVPTIIDP